MLRFPLAVLAALLLVSSAAQPARSADPYDVNVILSLTGPGAFLGNAQAKTMNAIEHLVNRTGGIKGRPIHFVIQDDQTMPQVAVQLTNRLLSEHVPIMLGPNTGASCFAVMAVVKNGPVQYCFAPTIHPKAPSYTFSAGVSTKDLALAGLRWFHARGINKIGLLASTDVSGQDGATVTREDVALPEMKGMQIVATEHFNTTDISVDAQLSRIKAAGAQLLYAQTTGTPFGTVLKDANDTALGLPVLTNAGNINYVQLAQYQKFLPKELYFTGLRYQAYTNGGPGAVGDANRQFISALKAVGVSRPDVTYTFAWDATMIAVNALRRFGTNASPAQIRTYIAGLHGYAGINGEMDFRDGQQRGLKEKGALVVRWDAAKNDFVPVSKPGGFVLNPSK